MDKINDTTIEKPMILFKIVYNIKLEQNFS